MSPVTYTFLALIYFVISFFVLRVVVRRDYCSRGQLGPRVATLQAIVFFLLGTFIWVTLPQRIAAPPATLVLLAWVLIVVGFGIGLVAMSRLGMLRSLGRDATALMQSGLYRRTRNPQVLAFGAGLLGVVLLLGSWQAWGWVILYTGATHMMVLTEEEHLRRAHGESYRLYCARVPRYLGPRCRPRRPTSA